MLNKPPWVISDFFASYTVLCVEMIDFVPGSRHLPEVLISFVHSRKTAAEVHWDLQEIHGDAALSGTKCRDWFCLYKPTDFVVDAGSCKKD